jgi:integrase
VAGSGIASKETILRVHLVPLLGYKALDRITTADVQDLKARLSHRSAKTANNVLTVLGVMLRTAAEWGLIERVACTIKLLPIPKSTASFYDFKEYERLVTAAETDPLARLVVLLGGEAGLRCAEMMALSWTDVDLQARRLCVARSEWKGQVTVPNGGLRHVPLTRRLINALRSARHLRVERVLNDEQGRPLTQKVVQGLMARVARRAHVRPGVHILRHTFCSHLSMKGVPARSIQELAGHSDLATTLRYMHLSPASLDAAIRTLETGTAVGMGPIRGEMVEAAGK